MQKKQIKAIVIEELEEDSQENPPPREQRDLSRSRSLLISSRDESRDENRDENGRDEDEKCQRDENFEDENEKDESEKDENESDRSLQYRFRVQAKVTFSIIFALYNDYVERERIRLQNPGRYKTGTSIRDIAERRKLAKSTVYFYFRKFKRNPYYIIGKYYQYRDKSFENIRKRKPKYYPFEAELEIVDWILRNRQEGLIVTGDEIMERAMKVIKCPRTKFTRRWLVKFMTRHNLSFRKPTHITKALKSENLQKKISNFHQTISILRQKFNYQDVYVINMDETAVFFDYNVKTVEATGTKFVTRAQMGDEKRKVTSVITVSADGTILRPMIIYNNKEVLQLDSEDYASNPVFVWTKNGWMDADTMLIWFKKILLPHVNC